MSTSDNISWIYWYCGLAGNELFCEVDEDFIRDNFNLTGISQQVPHYREALDVILDWEPDDDLGNNHSQSELIKQEAKMLYGLIHARFILTSLGIARMFIKWQDGDFGSCPRVYCDNQRALPIGLSS